MRRNTTTDRGFTLIALLVVIAIIAILAAILFPVFAKAREKARQTTCLSDVKQHTLAIFQYAQDYDETLPLISAWAGGLQYRWYQIVAPYSQGDNVYRNWWNFNEPVYRCPNALGSGPPNQCGPVYAMNYYLGGFDYGWFVMAPKSLGIIRRPAETVMVAEGNAILASCKTAYRSCTWQYRAAYNETPELLKTGGNSFCGSRPQAYHNAGSNVGFCDGHAKWMKLESFAFGQHLASHWQP